MADQAAQFKQGHSIPVTKQSFPGKESEMPDGPGPQRTYLPGEEGQKIPYLAAGKLRGKNAVITGGDSGIGRATAILFAEEGADSLIAYLPDEEEDAQETKKAVEAHGRKCHLFSADLSKQENCKKLADEAIKTFDGRIDILFNNAAYQMMVEDIKDLPEDQWYGSTIINNASINAYIGRPDLLDYTSTKGAIVSFTRGLSNQYVDKGIRVNAVAPGPVWTPLILATMNDEAQKQSTAPIGRPGQPSEIAACVVFLASADSSCVAGQTIHCNGGVVVNG
ncbi:hypothetical protein F5883DRAFT_716385 [Diaporthe sp. PMI_573]|nr:hypothetical protein F5883DRAFT_716385 [Diaporthaceae sp. PMI_573]